MMTKSNRNDIRIKGMFLVFVILVDFQNRRGNPEEGKFPIIWRQIQKLGCFTFTHHLFFNFKTTLLFRVVVTKK